MNALFLCLLVWGAAYLVGAIPFGFLVARWRGVDIFQAGSGNIGATNVSRVLGVRFGVLVFFLDFAKGAVPVGVALSLKRVAEPSLLIESGWLEVGAGLAAFLGHLYPIYLRFRGGKGVATGAGVVAVLFVGPTLGAILVWFTVVAATGYVSLGSLAAAVALCVLQGVLAGFSVDDPRTWFCVFTATLVFVRHRANVRRLWKGEESRLPEGGTMQQAGKVMHVLALGLWFGMSVFFSFVVALSLFHTFEELGKKPAAEREPWFPLPAEFARVEPEMNGPREQGSRAAGYAVGPMFDWYFLLQGICGFIALGTAISWARSHPGSRAHRWRVRLLALALLTVVIGWPIERRVAELRPARNQATSEFLSSAAEDRPAKRERMLEARGAFGRWHMISLLLNMATLLLVTPAMALAAKLPGEPTRV